MQIPQVLKTLAISDVFYTYEIKPFKVNLKYREAGAWHFLHFISGPILYFGVRSFSQFSLSGVIRCFLCGGPGSSPFGVWNLATAVACLKSQCLICLHAKATRIHFACLCHIFVSVSYLCSVVKLRKMLLALKDILADMTIRKQWPITILCPDGNSLILRMDYSHI